VKPEYFTHETDEWVEDKIGHLMGPQIMNYVIALKQHGDKRKALFIALTYPIEDKGGDVEMKT